MALPAGTRLGSYEIVAPLGSGGMGDVYRARDSRLNRDVAIKVLPERLAHDPVALARFEREAQAVAALSHPNILAIFDFGTQGTTSYAVSELLEGETLRARLAEGALPSRKAVEIAIGVARGIAAAHERGIIHRDLKPENIFITSDSVVKILDFGLARAAGPELSSADAASETRAALTGEGTVLGTVGYMAPEQIRGQAIDARADLFALGAVLYEMLSGERAFRRDTAAETMTAILKEDPTDFSGSRAMNPVLERIVRHCLEKIPAERFQTARDVAFALEALSGANTPSGVSARDAFEGDKVSDRGARTAGRERWLWLAATLAASAAAAWFAFRPPAAAPVPGDAVRTVIQLPRNYIFRSATPPVRRLAISPDGKRLAYVVAGRGAAETTLYVYSFAAGTSTVVPESRAALGPFWSADGNTLAFSQDNRLMMVDAAGGRPTELAAANPGGASWNAAGDIVSIDDAGRQLRIMRQGTGEWREVNGGPAEKQRFLANPIWLRDGQRFIFTMGGPDVTTGVYQGDINGTPWRRLRDLSIERDSMNVSYVAGHLISVRDRMIVASPFSPDGANQAGEPVTLGGPVDTATRGSAAFAVSDSLLVYQPIQAETTTRLLWYDRTGANISQLVDDAGYSNLELSPDGSQLLVGILDPAVRTRDIWVVDLKRGIRSRLTSDPRLDERSAVWGRDNTSFVYRGENRDLYRRPIGAGAAQPFIVDGRSKDPRMFSADSKYFIYRVSGEGTSNDIWIKPLDPDGPPRALIASVFNESYADVSPDGRWIVYVSDESGQEDVYVTAFPSGAGKWRVSPAGGSVPRWSHDGHEMFYLSSDRVLMRVAVRPSGSTFDFDAPTPLFQTNADRGPGPQFIVTNDGKRFLINSEIAVGAPESLAVVANWQALLKKK